MAASARYASVAPLPKPRATNEGDPREADTPANGVIRLPSFLVEESKLRAPSERDMLTPKGRLDLALKRRPGLRIGALGPLKNTFWAKALLDEDFAAERSAEANEILGVGVGRHAPMIFRAPPNIIPQKSGPWGGLLVPWERR